MGDFHLHHPPWSHHKSAEALIQVAEHEFVRQPERLICLLASDLEVICVWCVQRIIVLQKSLLYLTQHLRGGRSAARRVYTDGSGYKNGGAAAVWGSITVRKHRKKRPYSSPNCWGSICVETEVMLDLSRSHDALYLTEASNLIELLICCKPSSSAIL